MKQKKKHRFLRFLLLLAVLWFALPYLNPLLRDLQVRQLSLVEVPEWVDVQIIPVDGTSRRGEKLTDIQNIVIHYVANPGTTALQNRNWYENPESEVSSHFVIGLEGEVIQCIPLNEFSSASNHRNCNTISIEVCHPDESGKFTDVSYDTLVELTVWLLKTCHLDTADVIRHHDITGKDCPRYFVQNEESWQEFLYDVSHRLKEEKYPWTKENMP